jgi:hypothetical protein
MNLLGGRSQELEASGIPGQTALVDVNHSFGKSSAVESEPRNARRT